MATCPKLTQKTVKNWMGEKMKIDWCKKAKREAKPYMWQDPCNGDYKSCPSYKSRKR